MALLLRRRSPALGPRPGRGWSQAVAKPGSGRAAPGPGRARSGLGGACPGRDRVGGLGPGPKGAQASLGREALRPKRPKMALGVGPLGPREPRCLRTGPMAQGAHPKPP